MIFDLLLIVCYFIFLSKYISVTAFSNKVMLGRYSTVCDTY